MGADEVLTTGRVGGSAGRARGWTVPTSSSTPLGASFTQAIDAAAMGATSHRVRHERQRARAAFTRSRSPRRACRSSAYISNFTFPTAIRLVEGGALRLAPMLTHVLPLERLTEGLDLLRSGAATKVVVTPA
jgi:threonine dehydrogenase-like Zn-dependent dehydrogenase